MITLELKMSQSSSCWLTKKSIKWIWKQLTWTHQGPHLEMDIESSSSESEIITARQNQHEAFRAMMTKIFFSKCGSLWRTRNDMSSLALKLRHIKCLFSEFKTPFCSGSIIFRAIWVTNLKFGTVRHTFKMTPLRRGLSLKLSEPLLTHIQVT